MKTITLIIDGNNFYDLDSFYNEIDNVFIEIIGFETGHNFDAFNDILSGGFGIFTHEDSINLIWKNFNKSKNDLNKDDIEILLDIINDSDHMIFTTED